MTTNADVHLFYRKPRVLRQLLTVTLCALSLQACSAPQMVDETGAPVFGSSVTPMDNDPTATIVREVFVDGNWVGSAGKGGGTVASGITLPVKWRPGLTAVVKWERCEPYAKNCRWHEKVVSIQRYDEVGGTWLHIMPGDNVLIIPSMLGPDHPDYPGPGYPPKKPFKDDDE